MQHTEAELCVLLSDVIDFYIEAKYPDWWKMFVSHELERGVNNLKAHKNVVFLKQYSDEHKNVKWT